MVRPCKVAGRSFHSRICQAMTKQDKHDAFPVAMTVSDEAHYVLRPTTPAETNAGEVIDPKPESHGLFATALSTSATSFALIIVFTTALLFDMFMFVFLIFGLFSGIGLLPAACIGVVILSLFKALIRPLAKLDEVLFAQRKALYDNLFERKPAHSTV
ncbi:unnamed protein product [Aphanomyces euteiches]